LQIARARRRGQRARRKNRARVEALSAASKLKVLLNSNVLDMGVEIVRKYREP